jgi:hypothetical protein
MLKKNNLLEVYYPFKIPGERERILKGYLHFEAPFSRNLATEHITS